MSVISYWVLPVISGFSWALTLFVLMLYWLANCRPQYASMDRRQTIAYISDVGATSLKPFFIVGCTLTTIFHNLSLLSEIWLRYNGRLVKNTSLGQKAIVWFSLLFAINGTAGLILLSIFDTLRYKRLHNIFLALFIIGFVLSAIFICWEYQRLGIHFRQERILRSSFWIKLGFIIVELGLVAAFAATSFKKLYDTAAILEWTIALIFSLYMFSFAIDLLPAYNTRGKKSNKSRTPLETEMQPEMAMN